MATKFYNTPPYYDDFDPTKNYVRILFRPGYAVQARELTQLQTAIAAQIDRFGSYVFKDGTPLVAGESTIDTLYAYVKLESTFTDGGTTYYPEGGSGQTAYYANALGRTLTGATTGITATVLEIIQSTTSDPLTAFVRYTGASTSNGGVSHVFSPEEILNYTESTGVSRKFKVKTAIVSPVGYGCRVSVNSGVYFVAGNFVHSPASSIIVSKYTNNPSARIVYKVTEQIITTSEDPTLVDNALGTPNESAPGAHRYQISLDLAVEPYAVSSRAEKNIIQLLLIYGGAVKGRASTELGALANEFATRTYEESGNYVVRPYQINIREYYNDGTNNGVYTAAQIQSENSGFTIQQAIDYGKARLAVGLEPSVSYVSGYRVINRDTVYVPLPKARDEAFINAASLFCPLGGYIYVKTLSGLPDITTYTKIKLKGAGGANDDIGTARARVIEYAGLYEGNPGTIPYYKLYLFDIEMFVGKSFSDTKSLIDDSVPGNDFTATCKDIDSAISTTVLYEPSANSLVYKLPANAIQSLRSSDDVTCDFIYKVRRKFDNIAPTGSTLQLSSGSESFESTTQSDYIIVNSSGVVQTLASAPVLGGNGATVTLTLTGTPGSNCYVIAPVTRKLVEKSKTFVSGVTSGTGVGQKAIATPNTVPGSYDSLDKTDILRIKAVHMSSSFATAATTSDIDISDRYELDNGQRENFYDVGRIQLRPGASAPIGRLLVVFDHFTHNPGDYFCVNSYAGIDYSLIPAFNSIKGIIPLRDAVDFRPTKSNDGSGFTEAGASTTNTIVPNSVIYTDIQHYLPRTDKIFVNKFSQFGAVTGISSSSPKPPEDPEEAMVLYTIGLNAYTFGPTDLSATMAENRRYTMRDIGRLEKRIENVEYYTALSLLERETASAQILDNNAQQRYKNGFVVDSFIDHGISALSHPDHRCSIDTTKGILRPDYAQQYVNLVPDLANSSGIKKTGDLVTLDYTEVVLIEQPYSSYVESVNPHSVYRWQGQLTMSPPGDDWIEVETRPAVSAAAPAETVEWVTVYRPEEATESELTQSIFNFHEINWFGTDGEDFPGHNPDQGGYSLEYGEQVGTTRSVRATAADGRTWDGQVTWTRPAIVRRVIPARSTNTQVTNTSAVVDTSVIPYIRSRKVYFRATGLKPNSRVYAFFDGVNVADYVRTESAFVDSTVNPDDKVYTSLISHPSGATSLVTNSSGELIGSFVIPNNTALKFKTGERVFQLVDNTLNDVSTAFTNCNATYKATGTKETRTSTVVSVDTPRYIPAPTPVAPIVVYPWGTISVQGRTPKYTGVPFNLNASVGNNQFTLNSLVVQERSNAADPSQWGNWVNLTPQGNVPLGGFSSDSVWRISPALPGTYQIRLIASWSNGSATTAQVDVTLTATPAELVGQGLDDRFYN